MNILVTGGRGFVGVNLCNRLVELGHSVCALDNETFPSPVRLSPLVAQVIANVKDVSAVLLDGLTHPPKFDIVYHLASLASPKCYKQFPLETIDTNVNGTTAICDFAVDNGAKLIFTSTSEVYGDPEMHPQSEDYNGNVDTMSDRACYSNDTEVLTKNGWKLFENLTLNDSLVTLNNKHKIEYHNPIEIIQYPYNGELIHFKNGRCDLLVTPNHNMYALTQSNKRKKNNVFAFYKAFEEIPGKWQHASMLKTAEYDANDIAYFHFPFVPEHVKNAKKSFVEKVSMDLWLEFFGYYITEGCCTKLDRSNRYRISISQSKEKNPKKWAAIKNCLKQMPFTHLSNDSYFTIHNKQLWLYLKQFGKSHEKFIPQSLLQCSKRQLGILFHALMLGDGYIGKTRQNKVRAVFYTTSIKLAGNMQELALKISLVSQCGFHDKRQKNQRPIYSIRFTNFADREKNWATPCYPDRKIVNYNGIVWCVNVPNHIVFVRRNGKPLFCGNCYDESKRLAETIIYERCKVHHLDRLDATVLRLFNTYGPGMRPDDGRAVSEFICRALQGHELQVYNNGLQTRSFCYISDMVQWLINAMSSKVGLGPYNVGNPDEHSIVGVIGVIGRLLNLWLEPQITYLEDYDLADPKVRCPDISRACRDLGQPDFTVFDEGLRRTIEYFREILL
jgi:UDP-glucuronate decarboxylase